MPDDTQTPPSELPPSDQTWGTDPFSGAKSFMEDWATMIFEFYNSLRKRGFSDEQALGLAQLWQTQYWGAILAIWYGGKSKKSD